MAGAGFRAGRADFCAAGAAALPVVVATAGLRARLGRGLRAGAGLGAAAEAGAATCPVTVEMLSPAFLAFLATARAEFFSAFAVFFFQRRGDFGPQGFSFGFCFHNKRFW